MPSEETKERIYKAVEFGRTVMHYGWIPLIIYIGYTRSTPQPTLIKYVFFFSASTTILSLCVFGLS
ncbi:TOM7 family-domain-containing protein [Phlebopus sp. FC_14]|nr:TOM7 family-domain-containing protein [Phlebopus sp. FC_14]